MLGPIWAKIKSNEKLHLAWCVGGIIGCLVVYGVLQVNELETSERPLRLQPTALQLIDHCQLTRSTHSFAGTDYARAFRWRNLQIFATFSPV